MYVRHACGGKKGQNLSQNQSMCAATTRALFEEWNLHAVNEHRRTELNAVSACRVDRVGEPFELGSSYYE